jgi:hypothetical protein
MHRAARILLDRSSADRDEKEEASPEDGFREGGWLTVGCPSEKMETAG